MKLHGYTSYTDTQFFTGYDKIVCIFILAKKSKHFLQDQSNLSFCSYEVQHRS